MNVLRHKYCSRFFAFVLSTSTLLWVVSPSLMARPDSSNPEWDRMAELVYSEGNEGLVPAFEAALLAEGRDTRDFLRYFIGYLRIHQPSEPFSLFSLDWSDADIANRLYARINSFRSDPAVLPSWSSSATGYPAGSDVRHVSAILRIGFLRDAAFQRDYSSPFAHFHWQHHHLALLTNLNPQGP